MQGTKDLGTLRGQIVSKWYEMHEEHGFIGAMSLTHLALILWQMQ